MIPKEVQEHFDKIKQRGFGEIVTLVDKYAIIRVKGFGFHFCGYTWFNKNAVPESWHDYSNIHYDLDIHGGITFGEVMGDYIVYGFDCAHLYDDENPKLTDASYILELCQVMRSEIISGIRRWCKETSEELKQIADNCKKTGDQG